jgi:two-component system sensor histidine kinase ChvG
LLDLYWGGPERRITGITVRIIAVNAIALVMLMIGIMYLGQYQKSLIEDKLENFRNEVVLISEAISEAALADSASTESFKIDRRQAINIAVRLSKAVRKKIILFDSKGKILARPEELYANEDYFRDVGPHRSLYSIEVLKSMAAFVLDRMPNQKRLPSYPDPGSDLAGDYPDAGEALEGNISISAWLDKEERVFLSAAAPLYKNNTIYGAVLLTREGRDIERYVVEVWVNILKAFGITLVLTILLSIYLSGVIARPLRKLAAAAEGVRKGKLNYNDIPDLGHRYDEIGELSIALRQMTGALWERMDSTAAFAADVAHELKNPLTSLRSAVETAGIVRDDADRDKLMNIIRHDIERMDRLITDISNISRLEADLSRETLEKVNLKALLKQIIDAYKDPLNRQPKDAVLPSDSTQYEGKEIRLHCPGSENLYVWGLDGRLAQVFQNLLSNALSFSPAGGVIVISVQSKDQHIEVTVEDQGPGIPDSKLISIFERFYSQRPAHETYGKHSGLGLSICRQIVEALGGEIFAQNVKDKDGNIAGARFTVLLEQA